MLLAKTKAVIHNVIRAVEGIPPSDPSDAESARTTAYTTETTSCVSMRSNASRFKSSPELKFQSRIVSNDLPFVSGKSALAMMTQVKDPSANTIIMEARE